MACSDKEASRARPFSSGGEAFSLAQRERHDATGKVQTPQDRNGQHQPAKRRQLAHSVHRHAVEPRVIENRPRDAKVVFARLVFGERRAAVAGWISEAPRGCRIAAIRTYFGNYIHEYPGSFARLHFGCRFTADVLAPRNKLSKVPESPRTYRFEDDYQRPAILRRNFQPMDVLSRECARPGRAVALRTEWSVFQVPSPQTNRNEAFWMVV